MIGLARRLLPRSITGSRVLDELGAVTNAAQEALLVCSEDAGVVLANSEYRHELEADIDPFRGLLLGLFFVTVGAAINFALLFKNGD